VKRAAIETGMGMPLVERLQHKFGGAKVRRLYVGEQRIDVALGPRAFSKSASTSFPSTTTKSSDLTAIKRIVTTSSNHLRFDADRTENSHADIYWAKAVADLAADSRRQSLDGYGVFGGTSGLRNFNGGGFLTCFDPKEKYVKQAKASGPGQHPQRASYTFGANLEIRNFASSRGGSIKYFGRQSPGDARLQP